MLQIAAGDGVALGVRRQPAFAVPQQLVNLVIADPVMFLVVEHRHEHVEVARADRSAGIRRAGPRCSTAHHPSPRTSRPAVAGLGGNGVTQGLEQAAQERFTAATRQHRDPRLQRKRRLGESRPLLAACRPGRRPEDARDRDAEERRSDIGAIVDVLFQRMPGADGPRRLRTRPIGSTSSSSAAVQRSWAGFGIEDVRAAEREREGLAALGILVQQVAQIGRR